MIVQPDKESAPDKMTWNITKQWAVFRGKAANGIKSKSMRLHFATYG
jgi:hypothetical protein